MVYKLSSVQLLYRISGVLIILTPAAFYTIHLAQGNEPSLLINLFIFLSITSFYLYWKAGVYVKVYDKYIDSRLFPFPKVRIPNDSVVSVSIKDVTPLGREWGNRGKKGRENTLFLDAGQNKKCLEISTKDNFTLQLGINENSDLLWMDDYKLIIEEMRNGKAEGRR
ncbi:hypothetical protein [Rothia sp. ZJ1223]|uniref:hypothetical protein n=1 Tax=Rothia sp. ZJ1223 TaxID=2811098 RepID=UPI00195A3013|nr:hypothetical protein [Rothia sp. ZJ1223]MBM7050416.1 hypothetical protein [Rothia sp. ZJ1223]